MLTLNAANTYTGPTTVASGILRVANLTGSATGTGTTLSVADGASFGGNGTVGSTAKPVTVTVSATTQARSAGVKRPPQAPWLSKTPETSRSREPIRHSSSA